MRISPKRGFRHFRATMLNSRRRVRHPLLRVALGLIGIALLVALVVVGVFVGAAMLLGGWLWRAWLTRKQPPRPRAASIDASFRVVPKSQLPMPR